MSEMYVLHNATQENGKTIRENNLLKGHDIPIGTLVEVKYDEWYGGGACVKVHARLWVILHTRDCDGSPMYSLSVYPDSWVLLVHGFDATDLTPVAVDDRLQEGHGALEWEEDDTEQTAAAGEGGG